VRASGRRYGAGRAGKHDKPAVRGSIIANLLQDHDNPFLLYPYESNYLLYTWTSDLNKERFAAMTGPKMRVKMK
jgi:outer membrane phospholipase A